ncbi:hypothetical protein BOTBODRAFT_42101 [Botryobasidium botryosum FD-172 SS1]|uniref:RING-type domain-containing protein n=1 Tax=Botryobasidium botryosum (strain FD-172 SS1) TaxID=930990 RepID=A0A067MRY5_BOTB1|nr:hypothetical protein BOTBODRAFT_42101 [Botryobasidium botryosum FD-172 SS1]
MWLQKCEAALRDPIKGALDWSGHLGLVLDQLKVWRSQLSEVVGEEIFGKGVALNETMAKIQPLQVEMDAQIRTKFCGTRHYRNKAVTARWLCRLWMYPGLTPTTYRDSLTVNAFLDSRPLSGLHSRQSTRLSAASTYSNQEGECEMAPPSRRSPHKPPRLELGVLSTTSSRRGSVSSVSSIQTLEFDLEPTSTSPTSPLIGYSSPLSETSVPPRKPEQTAEEINDSKLVLNETGGRCPGRMGRPNRPGCRHHTQEGETGGSGSGSGEGAGGGVAGDESLIPDAIEVETCPICIVDFEVDDVDETWVMPCDSHHRFHKDCMGLLLELSASCPICRKSSFTRSRSQSRLDDIHVSFAFGLYL